MPWITDTADVAALTGYAGAVTQADVDRAEAFIADEVDRHPDTPNVSARDTARLRRAAAYQVAWMLTHPEVFAAPARVAASITQPDLSITYTDATSASSSAAAGPPLLAPVAARILRRVSWLRLPRTLKVKPAGTAGLAADDVDEVGPWEPLP